MPEQNDFGKDLGLVHQVVLAGRPIGADRDFWAALAEKKGLLEDVVAFVTAWLAPSVEDGEQAQKWLDGLTSRTHINEDESYYIRTSHNHFYGNLNMSHDAVDLRNLREKAKRSQQARVLLAEMDCYFVLRYVYSAFFVHKNIEGVRWMHHPVWAGFTTFDDFWVGDTCSFSLHFMTQAAFQANVQVQTVHEEMMKYEERDKTQLTTDEMDSLLEVCRTAVISQELRIRQLLDQIV